MPLPETLPEGAVILHESIAAGLAEMLGLAPGAADQAAYGVLRRVLETCGGEYFYVPKDIRLDTFTCDPKHTNSMTIYNQLSSAANDNTTDAADPFFALMKKWNGTDPATIPPLGENSYSYQRGWIQP